MYINKNEVLRYLGHKEQEIDSKLNNLIDSCIEETKTLAKPLITYNIFNIEIQNNEVKLLGCDVILSGEDITNHLRNSTKCVVLAASLGIFVDNRIRYFSKIDLTRSLILDSCGTEAVESLCCDAESKIREIAEKEGLEINNRYSPGYGDFPINVQADILKLLNAEKVIGLTCTEHYILLPRKSVTAVIGFVNKEQKIFKEGCKRCNFNINCMYRRDGVGCGF